MWGDTNDVGLVSSISGVGGVGGVGVMRVTMRLLVVMSLVVMLGEESDLLGIVSVVGMIRLVINRVNCESVGEDSEVLTGGTVQGE